MLAVAVAAALAAVPVTARAQQPSGVITGLVVERATRRPISDVQVIVVGTQQGTRTGEDGRFRIGGVSPGPHQIRTIRIGFGSVVQPITVVAGTTATAQFALATSAVTLEQVVTLATGQTERKRQSGNAISTVTPAQNDLATAQSPSQLLTGRAPGVDVATSGGTVGSGSRIRIRGANSLSLSNEPIIIIDGIRFNNAVGNDNTSGATTLGVGGQVPSRFNDINPEDIERIDILKGPAAAAL
ncbi:MAG: TonB-dependent receptor plug domain-containing protein, partial [Gemmatimonadaceae bacterium]